MKKMRKFRFLSHFVILSLVSVFSMLVMATDSHAAIDCKGCHAVPPLDSATRNIDTGAFAGNHQTHMPAVQGATNTTHDCAKCHGTATTSYLSGHSYTSPGINLRSDINASATGHYEYPVGGTTVTFKNQTSVPQLGGCSAVNCHFNATTTDVWGTTPYSGNYEVTCQKCHTNNPGGAHPSASAGGGKKHGDYYGTTTAACAKCHQDHRAGATPFQHATSVLHTPIQLQFTSFPNKGGSYSGTGLSYPTFLTPTNNGTCTNIYCHSDGTRTGGTLVTNTTAYAWSSVAGTLNCSGCHKASGATGSAVLSAISSGSHDTHVSTDTNKYHFACVKCHSATVDGAGNIISPAGGLHVNKVINVQFDSNTTAVNGRYNGMAAQHNNATVATNTVGAATKGFCNNIYCHSAGTSPTTFTPMSAPRWGKQLPTGTRKCTSCHGGDSTQPTFRKMSTGSHIMHIGGGKRNSVPARKRYTFGCVECHSTTVSNNTTIIPTTGIANHANRIIDVKGGTNLGTYTTDGHLPGGALGQCSTSYCHSNGAGGAPITTPAWNNPTGGNCGACHAATSAGWTGSATHTKHIAAGSYQYSCGTCHIRVVYNTANSTVQPAISSTKLHVSGSHNIDFDTAVTGTGVTPSYAAQACSNIYCHSDGTKVRTATSFTAVSSARWGKAAHCNNCHDYPPKYTSAGGVPKASNANSHVEHASFSCDNCHYSVTQNGTTIATAANHANGAYNLQQNLTVTFASVAGNPAAASTCSAISCHGGGSATWGTNTLNCQDCHGNGAVASTLFYNGSFWNDGTLSAKIQMTGTGSWADTGHGRLTATGPYPLTGHLAANFSVAQSCEYCHENNSVPGAQHKQAGNPFRLKNQADATYGPKNGVCMSCHAVGSGGVTVGGQLRNSTIKVGSYHHGAKHATNGGGSFCWDCHNGHGSSTNHQMIRAQVAVTSDAATGIPLTFNAVTFTKSATPVGSDYNTVSGICVVCHNGTNYYRLVGTGTNGYNQSASLAHNNTANCVSCHQHTNTASVTDGFAGGDCNACHGYPPVPRSQGKVLYTDFGKQGLYSSARFEDYSGGGGMHIIPAHVSPSVKTSGSFSNCTMCHANASAGHTVGDGIVKNNVVNVNVKINPAINYRFNQGTQASYSGAKFLNGGANHTGRCFNTSCHFKPSPKWGGTERP